MKFYDGNRLDTTEKENNAFLSIQSCGQQNNETEGVTFRQKGRKDYSIVFVRKGKVLVTYHGKSYRLSEGNAFFYEPNTPQYYSFSEHTVTFWVHFSGTSVPEILAVAGLAFGVYTQKFSERVAGQFRLLTKKFGLPRYRFDLYGILLTLLAAMADEISGSPAATNEEIIWKITSYIRDRYHQKITLDELAGLAGYSKGRFSHLFFQVTGTSPMAYQKNIRLSEAAEMLSVSSSSVKDVADACGFDDPLYFSKIFKQKFGVSPTEYRTLADPSFQVATPAEKREKTNPI